MSSVTAAVDGASGSISVVVLWQESFSVTGSVVDGANTKYVVGNAYPAAVGSTGYTFVLPDGFAQFMATLTGSTINPGTTDIDLYLTNARVVVAASTGTGDDEQILIGDMPGGTYELWAHGYTVTTFGAYSILVTGAVPLTVERVYPDGTTDEVLGSPTIPGLSDGYAVLWDTIPPANVALSYRVTDPLTNVTLTSNTVTVTGQGDGWLRDPAVPYNDVHFTECATPCPVPTPNLGGGVTQVALDTYSRVVTGGWGTADSGQAWSVVAGTASDFSTTGTTGQISLGSVNVERVINNVVSAASVDVILDVQGPVFALTAPINAYIIARYVDANNQYRVRLAFNTDHTISLGAEKIVAAAFTIIQAQVNQPGVFHIVGTWYRLRVQVDGNVIRAKVWAHGTAEPTDWTFSITDSSLSAAGVVGVRALLSATNTNTLPVLMQFDNLAVTTVVIPTQIGPDVDRRAVFQSVDVENFDSRSGLFDILDTSHVASVASVRRTASSTLQLLTQLLSQAQGMENILASGRALVLQLAAAYGFAYDMWASDWIGVEGVTKGRISTSTMTFPERTWRLPFTRARPVPTVTGRVGGNGLGPLGKTYYDEMISGLSYQDEVTAGGTYMQASLGQVP